MIGRDQKACRIFFLLTNPADGFSCILNVHAIAGKISPVSGIFQIDRVAGKQNKPPLAILNSDGEKTIRMARRIDQHNRSILKYVITSAGRSDSCILIFKWLQIHHVEGISLIAQQMKFRIPDFRRGSMKRSGVLQIPQAGCVIKIKVRQPDAVNLFRFDAKLLQLMNQRIFRMEQRR